MNRRCSMNYVISVERDEAGGRVRQS